MTVHLIWKKWSILFCIFLAFFAIRFAFQMAEPVYRTLDSVPVVVLSEEHVLPLEAVEVSFYLETCCDQMSLRHWKVGLGYMVHYENMYHRQLFANCDDAGIESPSDPLKPHEAYAFCDGQRYEISSNHQSIAIQKTNEESISSIALPIGSKTISYNQNMQQQFPMEGY